MAVSRKALADKILVLGIDGMDPRLTKKYLDQGKLPNVQKLIDLGSAREDVGMLGAQPPVTPPMWTTLATGAYPVTHGCTGGLAAKIGEIDASLYNFDSRMCEAEQLWNVFAEAGKKTLVWGWPGSSWPPSLDSENLHVVDGAQPMGPNIGVQKGFDIIFVANTDVEAPVYRRKAATDAHTACVVSDLEADSDEGTVLDLANADCSRTIVLTLAEGECGISNTPFDIALSPIKDTHGWANAPEDAKEFVMLFSEGLTPRQCLILKNEKGVYDRVAIYKTKKDAEPIVVLEDGVFTQDIVDDVIYHDQKCTCTRNMRLLEVRPDGTGIKIWASGAMEIGDDTFWHPKSLYQSVVDNVGYPKPIPILGGANKQLIEDCMIGEWNSICDWNADALNYLIEREDYDIVFSQVHNVDGQAHMLVKFLKDHGDSLLPEETYAEYMYRVYEQTDKYVEKFLYLLDKGWTIVLVSDHGLVASEYEPLLMADGFGVTGGVMEELGLTVFKKDENGNSIHEIDWEKTIAVNNRGNHIYVNLKGRDAHGIVEPKDKYEVEEEIMTRLYGYKHPVTGKRLAGLAIRNKDAVLLGLGGPKSGDIIYFNTEGYNFDHADALSTTQGPGDTSVAPVFIAAGPGIKKGFVTDRIIREVDVAPTVAYLGGVRLPAQCEGAPVYQILTEDI